MLEAGCARIKITPPVGSALGGYEARTEHSTGVHDELYLRALALSDGSTTVVLLVADVLLVGSEFVANARQVISAATGLLAGNIMIAASHTHSGPAGIVTPSELAGLLAIFSPFIGPPDLTYQSFLVDSMAQAVQQALADMRPARVASGGVGVRTGANRRSINGPTDHEVALLRFEDEYDRNIALLFSQGTHPTVLSASNTEISGDFLGLACQELEKLDPDLIALGLTGAAGDVSTRFTRGESSFAEAEQTADKLIKTVYRASRRLTPLKVDRLRFESAIMHLPSAPPQPIATLLERQDAGLLKLARLRNQGAPPALIRLVETGLDGISLKLAAQERQPPPAFLTVEVAALKIGRAILYALPVELFSQLGIELRQSMRPTQALVVCFTNGYYGYVPAAPEFEAGGYEVEMALLAEGAGERLVEFAKRLSVFDDM